MKTTPVSAKTSGKVLNYLILAAQDARVRE